ncbi:putative transporter (transmembrane protein) [Micromonospora pisi]|uniref:Putative transporter (Transmembrane protein) n=1 Tax=Micromonospora pisi TaxID=589240 RepID=A0A495JSB0_9ACTN|nr:hypothetical protein [Micromonospora pisi]RKR91495.1 putative transporter (transmembrane protein) [Micromonospora pisi]
MPAILALRRGDVGVQFAEAWDSVLVFVPRLIGCVGILMLGWLLARFVLRMALRLLDRFGFDQIVQRGGLGRLVARTRYRPAAVLARLGYYLILLFALQLGLAIWGPNPAHDLVTAVVEWLPRAFVALVVVAVSVVIANAVHDLVSDTVGAVSYGRPFADVVSLLVVGLGVIAAFVQTGVASGVTGPVLVTLLATVGGILVVGIGGGLVKPMQERWERWLSRLASESRLRRANRETYPRPGDPGPFGQPAVPARAAVPLFPDPPLAEMPTSPAPDGLAGFDPVPVPVPQGLIGDDPARVNALASYDPGTDATAADYQLVAGYGSEAGGLAGTYEPAPEGLSTTLQSGPDGFSTLQTGPDGFSTLQTGPDGFSTLQTGSDGATAYRPAPGAQESGGYPSDLLTPAPERPVTGDDDGTR